MSGWISSPIQTIHRIPGAPWDNERFPQKPVSWIEKMEWLKICFGYSLLGRNRQGVAPNRKTKWVIMEGGDQSLARRTWSKALSVVFWWSHSGNPRRRIHRTLLFTTDSRRTFLHRKMVQDQIPCQKNFRFNEARSSCSISIEGTVGRQQRVGGDMISANGRIRDLRLQVCQTRFKRVWSYGLLVGIK